VGNFLKAVAWAIEQWERLWSTFDRTRFVSTGALRQAIAGPVDTAAWIYKGRVMLGETRKPILPHPRSISKNTFIAFFLLLPTFCGFTQGLVNFSNTYATLVSAGPVGEGSLIMTPPDRYYFGLFVGREGSPSGAGKSPCQAWYLWFS